MYKRMLRSVLVTVFAVAALLLAANISPGDVGWDSVQAGSDTSGPGSDVGWDTGGQGSDVGWDSVPVNLADA
ncbi:hypothetical protein ACFVXE_27100 [Streptomyces sp. NPDC058231]|uniref:hypothetical protein n=1 Tax=Streptomyces sp. NPDC058231 TaxID=3346392 RepID=UPI0036E088B4